MGIDKARMGPPIKSITSDLLRGKTSQRVPEKMNIGDSARDSIGIVQLSHQDPVADGIRPVNRHGDQGRDLSQRPKHEYP